MEKISVADHIGPLMKFLLGLQALPVKMNGVPLNREHSKFSCPHFFLTMKGDFKSSMEKFQFFLNNVSLLSVH